LEVLTQIKHTGSGPNETVARAIAIQKLATAFICTGLFFLLLPGTFLGVWNLLAVSAHRAAHSLSPAWVQAHGHAQAFGWIGTFIIGIGFFSLSKMGAVSPNAITRGWWSWGLWTTGVSMRWAVGVYEWQWQILMPVSALFELAGFLLFYRTVRRHRPAGGEKRPRETWMQVVIASTIIFLLVLLLNLGAAIYVAAKEATPALPPELDHRFLLLAAWGFLVPTVWGFNARWLPVFIGLPQPGTRTMMAALALLATALVAGLAGLSLTAALMLVAAAILVTISLHIFRPSVQPAKTQGIHGSFPHFIRIAYGWLLAAAGLTCWAAVSDVNGGIVGASRHALTVGFLATMVFAIGSRVLPSFCGHHVLFSKNLMFVSLLLLNIGCFLRVSCEIPAYEANLAAAWAVLPFSAIIELTAVAVFSVNLLVTFFKISVSQALARKMHAYIS
jgi:hypothetical protein